MTAKGACLMLVEDDENDILFLKRAFAKAGLSGPHIVLKDGEEAVNYLSGAGTYADRGRHPLPSHLILDLKLPKKTGLELLEWIRANPALASTPVIILTSSTQPRDVERARALGVDDYLLKPVEARQLLETVRVIAALWQLSAGAPQA